MSPDLQMITRSNMQSASSDKNVPSQENVPVNLDNFQSVKNGHGLCEHVVTLDALQSTHAF